MAARRMKSTRQILAGARAQLAVAMLSLAVATVSALSVLGDVSTVDVIMLFFGGFGAGAMLTAAIGRMKTPSPPSGIRVRQS